MGMTSVHSGEITEDSVKAATRPSFRFRILYTGALIAAIISVGLQLSQQAAAFLDLIHYVGTDIADGSIIFPLSSLGQLIGSLMGGLLYDRYNKNFLIFTACLSGGILTLGLPWSPVLSILATLAALRSVGAGALLSAINTQCIRTWHGESASYLQAVHFGYAVGGIIGPIITRPFLLPKAITEGLKTGNVSRIMLQGEVSVGDIVDAIMNTSTNMNVPEHVEGYKNTIVHYSFIISGTYAVLVSLPFLIMSAKKDDTVWTERPVANTRHDSDHERAIHPQTNRRQSERKILRLTALIMFGALFFMTNAAEMPCFSYMMALVTEYVSWRKSEGALLIAILWAALTVGRLLGIPAVRVLSAGKLLAIDLTMLTAVLVAFALSARHSDAAIWVLVVLIGLFMSTIGASQYYWLDSKFVSITGKLTAFCNVCGCLGSLAANALVGFLFTKSGPLSVVYVSLVCTVVGLTLLIALQLLQLKLNKAEEPISPIIANVKHPDSEDLQNSEL